MRLRLRWRGPIGAGRFPSDPGKWDGLMAPGVYLRLKRYDGGRRVGYVGQSRNVLARIDQHLTTMLALRTPLRDARGRPAFSGEISARLAAYNDLEETALLAAREAMRTSFLIAWCGDGFATDHLDLVEGALKARIEERTAAAVGLAACENIQPVPADPCADVLSLDQDLGALAPEDAALLVQALGEEPIALHGALAGIGHAG